MKIVYLLSSTSALINIGYYPANAFITPKPFPARSFTRKLSTATNDVETESSIAPTPQKTLGLITFDLDDTLFPLKAVIDEANAAFVQAMDRFGYEGINASDIVEVGRKIRQELPPGEAAALSHTDIRNLAIRRVMEEITFHRKLEAMAEDFSTDVENLSKIVIEPARR